MKLAEAPPEKVRQPHGGALLAGGVNGHRGAGGRPRNRWRERCQKALKDADGLGFLGRVVAGQERIRLGFHRGKPIYGPPRIRDRLEALKVLLENGYGKPPPNLEDDNAPEPHATEQQAKDRIIERLPATLVALALSEEEINKLVAPALAQARTREFVRKALDSGPRPARPDGSNTHRLD